MQQTAPDEDYFFVQRVDGLELPAELKLALRTVQKKKACRHRVPIVEIVGENGQYFWLLPRKRYFVIANRLWRKVRESFESQLFFISARRRR